MLAVMLPLPLAWHITPISLELLQPPSRVWIAGTSTVRNFECKVPSFQAVVEAALPGAARRLSASEKVVTTAAVTVQAAQLDCGNDTMNKHMRNALKATEYPSIAFQVDSYELATDSARTRVVMRGTLALGGVTQAITVNAQATVDSGEVLRVRGTYDVRMGQFGLKPPTLFFGSLKVGDRVTVGFDLAFKG